MGQGALRNLNEKFAEAVRHHAHGRFAETETLCRHILRAAPRFTEAMVLLAVDPYWVTFLLGALILAAGWINRYRAVRIGED